MLVLFFNTFNPDLSKQESWWWWGNNNLHFTVRCSCFVCVCWQCLLLHLPGSPKEGKTWKDAQSICSSFESSLVTIDDEIEQGRGKVKCATSRWLADFTYKPEHYVCVLLPSSVGRRVRKENRSSVTFLFVICLLTCSIHHHVAPGKLSRCLDWSAGGQREMDQLQQLVSNWTKELSHCKLLLIPQIDLRGLMLEM